MHNGDEQDGPKLTGVITSVPMPLHILDTGTEAMKNFGDVLRWFGFRVSAKFCFLRCSVGMQILMNHDGDGVLLLQARSLGGDGRQGG